MEARIIAELGRGVAIGTRESAFSCRVASNEAALGLMSHVTRSTRAAAAGDLALVDREHPTRIAVGAPTPL